MEAEVKCEYAGGVLRLEPVGEIDHHTAAPLREKMDRELYYYHPRTAVLRLGSVTFMDSSGLGLILGRYTRQKELGGELKIEAPTPEVRKILRLAGVERLIEIEGIASPSGKKGGNKHEA